MWVYAAMLYDECMRLLHPTFECIVCNLHLPSGASCTYMCVLLRWPIVKLLYFGVWLQVPRIPVVSNVDAQPHSDPATIKAILAKQVTSPVLWENTFEALFEKGLTKSYEIGPGKVVAGIAKRINKQHDIVNITA